MLTEKDYCDYETCVALKELGFPQHITEDAYIIDNYGEDKYDIGERLPIPLIPDYMDDVAAPTLYEAQKWLREEKDIHIEVFFSLMDDKRQLHYDWHIVHNIRFDDDEYTYDCDVLDSMGSYKSYEEALSEGIKKAVKILK